MNKRVFAVILSVLTVSFCLFLALQSAFLAEDGGVTGAIECTQRGEKKGDLVKIHILFDRKVCAAQLVLEYNEDILELDGLSTDVENSYVTQDTYNPDKIIFAARDPSSSSSQPFEVIFRLKKDHGINRELSVEAENVKVTEGIWKEPEGCWEYRSVECSGIAWSGQTKSDETGCREIRLTVYKSAGDRSNGTSGREYTAESLGDAFTVSVIGSERLYFTLEVSPKDDKAVVWCSEKEGKLDVGKEREITVRITAQNGESKVYTLRIILKQCDHSYKRILGSGVMPSCTSDGYYMASCELCLNIERFTLKSTGHKYQSKSVEPSCTERGYVLKECELCKDKYIEDESDALGHEYELVHSSASCIDKGEDSFECKRCGDGFKVEGKEFAPHKYESTLIAPECEKQGKVIHVCTVCKDSFEDGFINALGHKYKVITVPPDCTKDGYSLRVCERCESSEICGRTDAAGHEMGQWTAVTLPDESTEGVEERRCARCAHKEERVIPRIELEKEENVEIKTEDGEGKDLRCIVKVVVVFLLALLAILTVLIVAALKKKKKKDREKQSIG